MPAGAVDGGPLEGLVQRLPFAAILARGPDHVVCGANAAATALFGDTVTVGQPLGVARLTGVAGGVRRIDELPVVVRHEGATVRRVLTVVQQPLPEAAGVLTMAVDITRWVDTASRSAFLARASAVLLDASLEREDALQRAAELAVPELGELCLINLVQQDGTLRRAAVVLDLPGDEAHQAAVDALWRVPPSHSSPAYRALRAGRTEIIGRPTGAQIQAIAGGDTLAARAIGDLGLVTTLVTPLQARGRVLGTISISSATPDRYTQTEAALAEELAHLASLAMDTAALYASERAAKEAANLARSRTIVLQRVTAELSAALDPVRIARVATEHGARVLGAASAVMYTVELDAMVVRHAVGWTMDVYEQYDRIPLRPGLPGTDAVLTGSPLWITDAATWLAAYPELATVLAERGYQATACVPLRGAEATLGLLAASFTTPQVFESEDREFLLAVAGQCAQALDRARLNAAELLARRAVEQQRDRLQFLAEASLLLDSPLSVTGRLQKLADLAVRRVADWCAVHLVRGRQVEQITVAHADPSRRELVVELQRRYPPDPNAKSGSVEVARSGVPQLIPRITDDMLVAAARDAAHLGLIRSLGMVSAMVVPLAVRGRVLGAITLVSAESGQHYTETDLAFAQDLASRAAMSVDNARLYEEQLTIAATLQAALLPYELPEIAGVRTGASYVAQGQTNEVGGDFYDVFASGSPGVWSVLIGDVCGKGATAAALTALVRHTVRAEASHQQSPEQVLRRLNHAILRQLGPAESRFCTALYGQLRASPGGTPVPVTLASGGHQPGRLLHADGSVAVLPAGGTALGLFDEPSIAVANARLNPGDSLVLFTDGVIEAKGAGGYYGTGRLDTLLAGLAGCQAQALADQVARDVISFQGGAPRDDVAVLVLQASG